MKYFQTLFALCIFLFSLYSLRQIFYFRYDPEYYENWYYTSQWNIPGSTRGIADGELYKFVGYRLVEGENPFNINFEVPPLGKYLYGLAQHSIGNPYWVSIFFYLALAFVLLFFLRDLEINKNLYLPALLLYLSTPFLATQMRETMLDLPLTFFLFTHVFLFSKFLKKSSIKYLFLAAVFLGLATGTKAGVYTPFILVLELLILFLKINQKIFNIFVLTIGSIIGYMTAFFCYFIRHPNPIPWLKLHQKALDFYLGPGGGPIDHFNQLKGIFLNSYHGWWQVQKMSLGDWSFLLPVGVIITIIILFRIRRQSLPITFMALFSCLLIIVNSLIPFFPRYLMPSVPLFIILIVIFFKKYPFLIILLALLNLPFLSQSLNSFDVQGHTQAVSRFISTTAYRELYRSLLPTSSLVEESEFIKVNEYLFQTLSIRTIDVKIENIKQSDNDASADYTISYITKYGPISNTSNLKFTRFHNQWKLVWDWNYLLPNFLPTSQFDIKTSPITLKNLLDVNQKIIATRSPWKSVYAIPQAMYHWTEDVDDLAKLTGQSPNEIDKTIKKFVPDNYPRFVGYVNPTIGLEKGSQLVKSMGGVSLADVEYLNITAQNYPNVPYLSAYIHGLYINNPQYLYIPCQISLINNDKKTIITTFSISDKNLQLTVPPPSRQD